MKPPMEMQGPVIPLSDSVRAEAAAWIARLHGSGRSRALETGLRRWLKSDPAHARAFEIATEAWETGGSIAGAALPRMTGSFENRRPSFFRPRRLAAAAALLAVAAGALFYLLKSVDAISTAVGEQRMLTLDDGTRIFMNTDTRLRVREDAVRRLIRLDSGEAMFDVAGDPRRPFVVDAGDQEVTAIGTSFVVRRDPQRLTVTLMEGKVAVAPGESHGDRMMLEPGQRLTFVSREPPTLDAPPMERATAWRRGEVILDQTPLLDAAEEMNRYSAVKLVIGDAATADIRVSGIFRAGDSTRFAHAVGETYHLTIEQGPLRILISRRRPD